MTKNILITGGAGFIGSHLVDLLTENSNYNITVFDCLDEQIHTVRNKSPEYLNNRASFIKGSVNNYEKFEELVKENDIIFHLAATVGVGQSMYQIDRYIDNNVLGMANLLNILVNADHDVEKVILPSSNTVYGESKVSCKECGIIFPKLRQNTQLRNRDWELHCPKCGGLVRSLLTDEKSPYNSSSIYALSKQVQEEMTLMIGKTYGIDFSILRLFLVYGPRQAPSNPYTGVCAIFSTRLLNGMSPIVFEDGLQSRDFVNVKDVCQALLLTMNNQASKGEIFNVGTGIPITIKDVAETLTAKINPNLSPIYNQQYRIGDIRHCAADISKIKKLLGYSPKISFNEGLEEYIEWIKTQKNSQDKTEKALSELKEKGLMK
jgi:dTDP-L-rhamnose 4-epimerase